MNKDITMHSLEDGIYRRVMQWRETAVKKVLAIRSKKKAQKLAKEYYDIDQQSMVKDWPEMEKLIGDLGKRKRKGKPDITLDHARYKSNWEAELVREMESHYQTHNPERSTRLPIPERLAKHERTQRPYPVFQVKHLPNLQQYVRRYGRHVSQDKQTGKGRRFTGQMNRVISYQELKEACKAGLQPKYETYQARKDAGQTTTEILKRGSKK